MNEINIWLPLSYYLLFNGVGYVFLGLLCLFQPRRTSQLVGYNLIGEKGFAEYSAVYGGLELGLGLFYLLATFTPDYHTVALVFSLCLYGGIVLARVYSILVHGKNIGFVGILFALELLMLLGAIYFLGGV
jgi:hypothetical protein